MNRVSVLAFIAVAAIGGAVALEEESNSPAALQKRCADQAKRVFTAEGWPLDGRVVNYSVAHYTSQFNARLGRCLMLVAYTTNDPRDRNTRKSYTVSDAFEQATFAEYFESGLPGFSTAVLQCNLTLPKEKHVLCHSAKEWRRLVRPYIETGALIH